MAQSLDEIKEQLAEIKFIQDGYPYWQFLAHFKSNLHRLLRGEQNDKFFEFVQKIVKDIDTLFFYAWILEYQFNMHTAGGYFLDNLGAWNGLSRPPVVNIASVEKYVIPQKDTITDEEVLKEWNIRHGISGEGADDVKETYLAPDVITGFGRVSDDEYREYIKNIIRIKNDITISSIMQLFADVIFTSPFYIMQNDRQHGLEIRAYLYEDANRVLIARDICNRISTTGFKIFITQTVEDDDVKKRYGDDCWDRQK